MIVLSKCSLEDWEMDDIQVKYCPIEAKSALNPLKRKIPYGWDLNIYRGCQHGCKYCYAMYSHEYLNSNSFFSEIYIKQNIVEQLEKELKADSWKREVVNIGGVTDSYQPAEAEYKLMPEVLKLLIKYKTPAIISTKSSLILRDFDLIDELSRITYINVAATITTTDEEIRKLIEPGSHTSMSRFKMLKEFKRTNASTGVHLMPIIPFITDNEENFENIYKNSAEINVDYVLPGTLYLRGATRKFFLEFIGREFPEKSDAIYALYKTGGADKEYKNGLYEMVNKIRIKYRVSNSYMKPMREKL